MSLLDRLKQLFADARDGAAPGPAASRPAPSSGSEPALVTSASADLTPGAAATPPSGPESGLESPAAEPAPSAAGDESAPMPTAIAGSPDGRERRVKPRISARPGTRILVVDDSSTIVALLARMLRQNHFEVFEAADAESGLEIARREVPDLIFLDIVLPGMNGFAALRHLRREPVTKSIPIIMISGNEQATEQFYVQRIGADDFMKKPFSRAEVFARIERLLDAERVPRRPGAVAESTH